jgi:hypothetical protein
MPFFTPTVATTTKRSFPVVYDRCMGAVRGCGSWVRILGADLGCGSWVRISVSALINLFPSPRIGFRHDCTDAVLALRAENFSKMRKLVKRDRTKNNELAEENRIGEDVRTAKEVAENLDKARASGAVVDSDDEDDDAEDAE